MDASEEQEIKATLTDLFREQGLAVLATHRNGQPHCSLVAFAATDDLRHLLFATARQTRKFGNLSADPRVAMLVDNRSNAESDFREVIAVTAKGAAEDVNAGERDAMLRVYLARHPSLAEFVGSRDCAFLKVRVESYSVVSRFQQVRELRIASEDLNSSAAEAEA